MPQESQEQEGGAWQIRHHRLSNGRHANPHMRKWIAGLVGVFSTGNGLAMLFAGSIWWAATPGVRETGPINLHLVHDVGAAFVASGLALAALTWRTVYWPAAVAGAAFLVIHAVIHLAMIVSGHDQYAAADLAFVVLPAGLALYSAFPAPGAA